MNKYKTKVAILGSGPGGYSAAIRCSELGLKVIIIEKKNKLGGTCLNIGCIPSKMILYISKILEESKKLIKFGIKFNKIKINIKKIIKKKNKIIKKINLDLIKLIKKNKIKIIKGHGILMKKNKILIKKNNKIIKFKYLIISTGSKNKKIKIKKNKKIWYSTEALNLKKIPKKLLIIGGGVIGLEMSNIYQSLGSKVDIIENNKKIINSIDKDIRKIYTNILKKKINILTNTKIIYIKNKNNKIKIKTINKGKKKKKYYNNLIISIGRIPNNNFINKKINLKFNKKGFLKVNKKFETNIKNIFAIGDLISQPMLAHKAIKEGNIVAEIISGKKKKIKIKNIPNIIYTNPEIAWVGKTEKELILKNIKYRSINFKWSFLGKAIISNCRNGITKLIFDIKNKKIIGGTIIGKNAGELISEITLAIQMKAKANDIASTIHAHPTLYESIGITSEIFNKNIKKNFK